MKRSDVIKTIIKLIDYKREEFPAEMRAENLLGTLEEMGMVPASRIVEEMMECDADDGYGRWFKVDKLTKCLRNQWEEDDEKI